MFLDMVAALDRAALNGVVALVRGFAGEHILAMDWAMRNLVS